MVVHRTHHWNRKEEKKAKKYVHFYITFNYCIFVEVYDTCSIIVDTRS